MSARLARMDELRRPRHPLVGLNIRLALLQVAVEDFRRDLNAALETPFGLPHFEPDDSVVYLGDEDAA